ncbi:MAG TPA: hypothetical protein EYG86_00740 [Crocinitomicaceae bacterium]|nr:hypothetical protein [Crocinitomicaceae bacterium]
MSDQIQTLIVSIREKFSLVKEQLLTEKAENKELKNEVEELKSQLEVQKSKLNSLEVELEETKNNENDFSEQVISRSEGTMITEEQIDGLVKEIDYCIGQLKK